MADPVIPGSSDLSTVEDLTNKAKSAFDSFGDAALKAKDVLHDLYGQLGNINTTFKTNQSLTQDQAAAFSMLSVAVLGASKSFDSFSDIDTRSLNTFTQQITDLQQIILKDSALGTMTAKTEALASSLVKLGFPIEQVMSAASGGFKVLSNLATQMAASADEALQLRTEMIQLGAQTGALDEIYGAAGNNLEKINYLLQIQQQALNDAATATQLPIDSIKKYYAQLGTIPQALGAEVKSSTEAGRSIGMLTATIQYATGSGRNYKEVVDDLRTAFRDYNLVGEDALKFTARIGELSNKFGIEISDVRSALTATADSFKMFGNEAEGAAAMMNQYLGALQSTGLSGKAAIDVVSGMTDGLKNMTIAQKAFLSGQTGGSGGLMGAFQIEKLLREGKIDQVFDKVKQQMTKQFGQIVSLDDAANSPQAASQLTKQIMTLRQGPLGQFAKDDQSAIRILEAFKKGSATPAGALSPTVVQDNMKTGVDLQKQSATELTRIRTILQNTRGTASVTNLGTLQQGFAAGTGTPIEGADFGAEFRDTLSQNMQKGSAASGRDAAALKKALTTKSAQDQSGIMAGQLIDEYGDAFEALSTSLKVPVDKARQLIQGLRTGGPGGVVGGVDDIEGIFNAGDQVGAAATFSVKKPTASKPTTGNTGSVGAAATSDSDMLGEIVVHVEGYCLDCGDKMKGTTQSYAVNTGQKAKK